MANKNKCGKTREVDQPYEIWRNDRAGWEWRVLKKYQAPKNEVKNEYARWFCAVKSPATYGSWEYGDVFVKDVQNYSLLVSTDYPEVDL